ncbi:MAG: hypothetical protein ACE5EE_11030 [Fidelibacterota bacterium]
MALDFARTWLPYIYLYGAGGFIFLLGLLLIVRSGAINLNKKKHKFWLAVLFFGFIWYLAIHGFSTISALGGEEIVGVMIVIFLFIAGFSLIILRSFYGSSPR